MSVTDSRPIPLKRRTALFELLLAIASEQVGTAAMKASEGFTSIGPTVLAIVSYVLHVCECLRVSFRLVMFKSICDFEISEVHAILTISLTI